MLEKSAPLSPHHILHPAQLLFGNHDFLVNKTKEYLQYQLCSLNGCNSCIQCRHITEQQHHAALWLAPEKQYTLEQLEPIFNTIAFALAPQENFFFIIQKADKLTPACANSLLKSIEEPPAGYHFILLAERQDLILPTIRSRCVVQTFTSTDATMHSPLFMHFSNTQPDNPLQFMKDLDQSSIAEHESLELVDALLKHWIVEYKNAVVETNNKKTDFTQQIIAMLQNALLMPPMPGSSKLFWKNLFLDFNQISSSAHK